MSWTNAGPKTTLSPGQTAFWSYVFANWQDMGVQVAGANILEVAPNLLGTLVTSNQGKVVQGGSPSQLLASYVVTITNVDPTESAVHNLQGGGVS